MKENGAIYTISLVLLLTLSAYFLADTVDALIGRSLEASPAAATLAETGRRTIEPKRELSDYMQILDRGLFGDGRVPAKEGAVASSFRLIGTVEGEVFSGAVLEDASLVQNFYRLGEKLPDGSQLVKVMRDRAALRLSDGSTTDLQIVEDTKIVAVPKKGAGGPGIRKVADRKFMVDQGMVTSSTENLNQLLTQARALPYIENGKTAGFRISEIVPGSLFEKVGLQNGDIIQRINSQDVDDPGKFFQIYQGLKEEKNITVDVLRAGQRQTFSYEIR